MCNFCILFDFSSARTKVENGTAVIEKAPENIPFLQKDTFNYCPVCGSPLKEEMQVSDSFASNLRRIRRMRGMSQEALGRELHMQKSGVCKYEKGRTKPNIEKLAVLCRILDVSPQELI